MLKTGAHLAIAEEPAGNQENAAQSLVKQMHGRCGTVCYYGIAAAIFPLSSCTSLRNIWINAP
jgi:hypothetical protein